MAAPAGQRAVVAALILLAVLLVPRHAAALPPAMEDGGLHDAATDVVMAQARARGVSELPASPFLRRTRCGAAQDALLARSGAQRRALVRLRHAQRAGTVTARDRRSVRRARAAVRVARARARRTCAPVSRRSAVIEDVGRVMGSRQVERPRSAISGTGMVVALPVDFGDVPARRAEHAPSRYADLFFGDDYSHGGGSLDRYWRDMSYGSFGVDGTVAQWRRMPRPRSAYAGRHGGMGAFPANSQSLLEDAVRANDGAIDFGRYDNDGPDGRPNSGDDDGVVDAVFLVYAGAGAVEDGDLSGIWPHAWRRTVSTQDPAAGGGTIRVDRYAALPERMADEGSDGDLLTVGLAAHEYGHVLGLPDLVDHEDAPGPGRWDLMGSGVWGFRDSSRPTGLSSWSRARLGWTTPQLLEGDHPGHAMPSTYRSRSAVKLPIAGQPLHEHFLVERRTRTGFDADLPGDGLLVWHVDDSQPADGTGSHARVELVPADRVANGDAGDLLQPGVHLSDSSQPSTRAHAGSASLVVVQNVRETPGWSVDLHAGRASMAPVIDASIEASGPQAAPPVVALTTPTADSFVSGTVTMTCEASGAPDISRLSFTRSNGTVGLANVNINPSAPSVTRTNDWASASVADGPETLGCRARNTSNQWTDSATIPVTVDNTAPTQSAPGDGAVAPDLATQTDTTSLAAHWSAGSDATSGIARYDWQFCTTTTCETILASGTTATRSVTVGGLALTVGSTYHGCIRAVDRAGNVSAWTCSNGVQVVSAPPTMAGVRDGGSPPDLQFQASTSALAANWDAATGGSGGVASYDWRFCPTAGCATVLAGGTTTGLTATAGGLSLVHGATYVACVRATSGAGNSSAYACSNGVAVDAAAPTMAPPGDGAAPPDLQFQAGTSSLSAFWSAANDGPGSGVSSYAWRFCTTPTCGTILASGTGSGFTAAASGLALTAGSTYVACVRATDAVGNVGTFQCSDGVTVDTTAPVASAPNDGATAPDVDFQSSMTSLGANWAAAGDGTGSGVASYGWRFCTTAACTTVLASGSTTGLTATATALALTAGSTYHACISATDAVGNQSAWTCSDGVMVDDAAPVVGVPIDGAGAGDVDFQASTTTLDASWPAATAGPSGVAGYDWRFCPTSACSTVVASGSGTGLAAAATGLALPDGGTYVACVRATSTAGTPGAWSCSDGVAIDAAAPTLATPNDGAIAPDSDIQGSTTELHANWTAASDGPGSGVAAYDWRFCPTAACSTVVASGSGTATTASATGLSLATGTTYHACLRATDQVGNVGAWMCSDGITIDGGPTVTISSPAGGANVRGEVVVAASTTDGGGVTSVEYHVDGALLHTDGPYAASSPRTTSWTMSTRALSIPDGVRTIEVRAHDADGLTGSASVTVTVDNTAPGSVTMSGITAGSTVTGIVSLSSSGSDAQGIVRADYSIAGPTIVHSVTTAPQTTFSHLWSWNTTTVQDGNHTMRATLRDAAGNPTNTPLVRYVVHNAGDGTPPTGAIDPSLSGATLTGIVDLRANVGDDNAVVKVEFLIDGTLVGTPDTSMPAGFTSGQGLRTWTSTARTNGSHVLSARITDAGGNVTTTATVPVTIAN